MYIQSVLLFLAHFTDSISSFFALGVPVFNRCFFRALVNHLLLVCELDFPRARVCHTFINLFFFLSLASILLYSRSRLPRAPYISCIQSQFFSRSRFVLANAVKFLYSISMFLLALLHISRTSSRFSRTRECQTFHVANLDFFHARECAREKK
jgi:hypothetical protein